ncbi:MAG: hypothetical protein ACTHLO_21375, partial [Pseudolabrys sp.]
KNESAKRFCVTRFGVRVQRKVAGANMLMEQGFFKVFGAVSRPDFDPPENRFRPPFRACDAAPFRASRVELCAVPGAVNHGA